MRIFIFYFDDLVGEFETEEYRINIILFFAANYVKNR